ncbi:MAG: family 16 glycosylhydrolase [Fibrobacterales bacterium]
MKRFKVAALTSMALLFIGCFGDSSAPDADAEVSSDQESSVESLSDDGSSVAKDESSEGSQTGVESSEDEKSSAEDNQSVVDGESSADIEESSTDIDVSSSSVVVESSSEDDTSSTGENWRCPGCDTIPIHDGYTLYMVEEFDREIPFGEFMLDDNDEAPDPIWTWSDGGTFAGNQTRFAKDNIVIEDGIMKLIMKDEDGVTGDFSIAQDEFIVPNETTIITPTTTSGEMRTWNNDFRYGRYEVRLKAPINPNGRSFSTFFAYNTPRKTTWREIDVEVVNNPGYSETLITNIFNTDGIVGDEVYQYAPNFAYEFGANSDGQNTPPDGWNPNDGKFHVYAFVWLPESITWYIDGVQTRQHKKGDENEFVNPDGTSNEMKIPELPCSIMMNLWQPSFLEGINDFPVVAEYDWVRYWRWDEDENQDPSYEPVSIMPLR